MSPRGAPKVEGHRCPAGYVHQGLRDRANDRRTCVPGDEGALAELESFLDGLTREAAKGSVNRRTAKEAFEDACRKPKAR